MVHQEDVFEQPEVARILNRVLGGGGTQRRYIAPAIMHAVLDALTIGPLDSEVNTEVNTPAAGRSADFEVPSNQLWLLRFAAAFSDTDAVIVQPTSRFVPGARLVSIGEPLTTAGANSERVFSFSPVVPVWPAGLVRVAFGAGTLNANTEARIGFQRLFL